MSDLVSILDGAKGITTTVGLCAFAAGLIAWIVIRKRDVSVYERLLGAGAVRREDIVSILGQFKDDDLRLQALQRVLGGDHDKAKQLLSQAKSVEAIGGVSLSHMAMARNSLFGIGAVFIVLAIIGAGARHGPVIQPPVPPAGTSATNTTTTLSHGSDGGPIGSPQGVTPETSASGGKPSVPPAIVNVPGFQVQAGGVTYKILKGEVSQLSEANSTLKLTVQLINPGPESVMFSDSLFRIVIDGVPGAPKDVSITEWVARESSKTGDVTFVIPRPCREAILRVGHSPQQTDHTIEMKT